MTTILIAPEGTYNYKREGFLLICGTEKIPDFFFR